jgi:hypothetical protein
MSAMRSAADWKDYYARERDCLGLAGLAALINQPPPRPWPDTPTAAVFPHTRLRDSGDMTAAVARAVIQSNAEIVLAIGVLHGVDRTNEALRGIHRPDDAICAFEFSLDNFRALLAVAAERMGRPMPRLIERYPLVSGATPGDLSGVDELHDWIARGAALVATADPIHHGVGYGTPTNEQRKLDDPVTTDWVRHEITAAHDRLCRGDYAAFLDDCQRIRSDFRDAGPVVAMLLGASADRPLKHMLLDLRLIDYSAALAAAEPTWVCACLFQIGTVGISTIVNQ